jgi:hypothetical protein
MVVGFLDELPHKLKVDLSMHIYASRYESIKFFTNKSRSFISWICPLLKPSYYAEMEYIYSEGEEANMIYFMLSGKANYVLPSFDNVGYIGIDIGDHFGIIDIIGSAINNNIPVSKWYDNKIMLIRQFTIMAFNSVEMLNLSFNDLVRIQKEFSDYYLQIFSPSFKELRNAWIIRLKAMKECRIQYLRQDFKSLQDNSELLDDFDKRYQFEI